MNLRRSLAGITVAALLAALLVMLASASQAEPKKLLVGNSAAGPFRDNLSAPLFRDTGPFVPRDDATSTFWVKNNSRQVARATVAVVNRGSGNAFEDALRFEVDIADVHSTAQLSAPGADGCRLVTTGPNLEPGEVQAVDVRLLVADLDRQAGQQQAASLDFVVTLSQLGKQGQVNVCGQQATPDPASGDRGQCARDVVVSVAGTPTCVPTAVDAGRASRNGDGPVRNAGVVGLASVILIGTGASLLVLRRRRQQALCDAGHDPSE